MINIQVVDKIEDISLAKWNDLLGRTSNPLPFQRYEWVRSFLKQRLSDRRELFILLASKAGELVGIAPFVKKKKFGKKHYLIQFIGTGYFDYFDFIIQPGLEKEVIYSFLDEVSRSVKCFELELGNIFGSSFSSGVINSGIKSGSFQGLKYNQDVVPYLELPETVDDFYAGVKTRLRSDIERQKRRLKKLGELELRECLELDDALVVLEDFFSLHIKRWESKKGYSAYKFGYMRKLMRALLKDLFDTKIAAVYYLLHNKKDKIAVCFTYIMNGRFIYYAPSYDPRFATYSPGKILISLLIENAIENNLREFDFGIGDEAYKLEWASKNKELYTFYIFSKRKSFGTSIIKMIRILKSKYFYTILPCLRKFTFLVNFWRFMRRKMGDYSRFE